MAERTVVIESVRLGLLRRLAELPERKELIDWYDTDPSFEDQRVALREAARLGQVTLTFGNCQCECCGAVRCLVKLTDEGAASIAAHDLLASLSPAPRNG